MKIGVADADLIGKRQHRFPNLCLMKISGYHKGLGDAVELITNWSDIDGFDKVYISKVFTDTEVPKHILEMPNVVYGGTGFYYDKAPPLPDEIEHHMPDYNLYSDWVQSVIDAGFKKNSFIYYTDCSIGFLTRHCFRGCGFCVNKNYKEVKFNANIDEFLDDSKKFIILLDDQFLGYGGWVNLLDQLIETGKPFQFRQGLDIRLMTPEKAKKLASSNYYGGFIFAFDDIKDEKLIRKNLELWRRHTNKKTKLYVFCGFDSEGKYDEQFWLRDIESVFKRVFILAEYDCVAYVMRHQDHELSPYKSIYTGLAAWCNQPWALRTLTFREFCIGSGMGKKYKQYKNNPDEYLRDGYKKGAQWLAMENFEKMYPDIAGRYFDRKYNDYIGRYE